MDEYIFSNKKELSIFKRMPPEMDSKDVENLNEHLQILENVKKSNEQRNNERKLKRKLRKMGLKIQTNETDNNTDNTDNTDSFINNDKEETPKEYHEKEIKMYFFTKNATEQMRQHWKNIQIYANDNVLFIENDNDGPYLDVETKNGILKLEGFWLSEFRWYFCAYVMARIKKRLSTLNELPNHSKAIVFNPNNELSLFFIDQFIQNNVEFYAIRQYNDNTKCGVYTKNNDIFFQELS